MADQLSELLAKLEIQEEYGGELNEHRKFGIDGKIVLCKEAESLVQNPQYLVSITTLRKKARHLATDWQQSAKDLVEIQLGGLQYNTLRLKVNKNGVLGKGDSSSSSSVAHVDFNHVVMKSARKPILALIDEFANEFVTEILKVLDPEGRVQKDHLDEKIAKLLETVKDEKAFMQDSRLALKDFWGSGNSAIFGKGAKENQMQKLRDWMDMNSCGVFMDMMKAAILRSYEEMQKIVHFIVSHPRTSNPHTPMKKVKSVRNTGANEGTTAGSSSDVGDQGKAIMAGLIRRNKRAGLAGTKAP